MAFAVVFPALAITVNNEAGTLSTRVDDTALTELTVTGTINAVDFAFIREQLPSLTTLDLSQAEITKCDITDRDGETRHYLAATLPDYALFGTALENVALPTSLTAIGESALAGCRALSAIDFPAGVTAIGDNAFNSTGLTSVVIPASVTTLGTGVFAHSRNLTTATFAPAEDMALSAQTFMGCTSLTQLNLGAGVEAIDAKALAGCTALSELNIAPGNRLAAIGESAFEGAGLTEVDLSECQNLESVGMYAFANSAARRVMLPESVTSLGQGAFFYSTELESVELPQGVTTLADFLMAGCSNYAHENVVGADVTEIGDYTFYNWDQMASFIIPASVEYIGTRAMAGMTGLRSFKADSETVPELGDEVWEGVDQPSVPLTVPKSSVAAYKATPQWQLFHIEDVPTDIDRVGDDDLATVKAHFSGTALIIEASADIASIELYTTAGVLLNRVAPAATTATLETVNYHGPVYIVAVTLADGSRRTLKLIKQ